VETDIHATVVCPGGVLTDWAETTEGGPILELFSRSGPAIKAIARERNLPLPPMQGVMSADAVAEKIVDCLHHPSAEIFTHDGSREFAALAAQNREEAERYQLAVALGERKAFEQLRRD
jgi:short-subunit dehydrogenase